MSNHRYSPEFKDEAVRQIIEAGHSVLTPHVFKEAKTATWLEYALELGKRLGD